MQKKQNPSKKTKLATGPVTIGIDIGDQWSHYCVLSDGGEVMEEGRFRTTADALEKHFAGASPTRVAIENGTHQFGLTNSFGDMAMMFL